MPPGAASAAHEDRGQVPLGHVAVPRADRAAGRLEGRVPGRRCGRPARGRGELVRLALRGERALIAAEAMAMRQSRRDAADVHAQDQPELRTRHPPRSRVRGDQPVKAGVTWERTRSSGSRYPHPAESARLAHVNDCSNYPRSSGHPAAQQRLVAPSPFLEAASPDAPGRRLQGHGRCRAGTAPQRDECNLGRHETA